MAEKAAAALKRGKKKSSGWRAWDKRNTTEERQAMRLVMRTAQAHRDCEKLRLWLCCPARRCRRVRGCTGQPLDCLEEHRLARQREAQAQRAAAQPASGAAAPPATAGPVLSAKEAAALIAASIAEAKARGEIDDGG